MCKELNDRIIRSLRRDARLTEAETRARTLALLDAPGPAARWWRGAETSRPSRSMGAV